MGDRFQTGKSRAPGRPWDAHEWASTRVVEFAICKLTREKSVSIPNSKAATACSHSNYAKANGRVRRTRIATFLDELNSAWLEAQPRRTPSNELNQHRRTDRGTFLRRGDRLDQMLG
jgi:hypothetical protein